MKTKVNEIPLVGPKGRKELLKKVNELEVQVAQQDYIRIEIPTEPEFTTKFPQEKATELYARGVLLDVLLEIGYNGGKILSKIVGCVADETGEVVALQYAAEDHIALIEY